MQNIPKISMVLLSLIAMSVGVLHHAEGQPARRPAATHLQGPEGWAGFRGSDGLGISSQTGLPLTWGPQQNVAWKTELPGAGASSPVAIGDRIFLTCYSGYGVPEGPKSDLSALRRHLVSVDRRSGRILWNQTIEPELPEEPHQQFIEMHGYASSTPAVEEGRVYAFFGRTGLFAFDHDGRQLWRAMVGPQLHRYGSGSSPVLYRELVIVNASSESGSLLAFDKRTGRQVWQADGIRDSWGTPLLVETSNGKELVLAVSGRVLAFDPASGKSLWQCETRVNDYICPSVVAHGGVVYAVGGRSGVVLAVRAGGRGNVTRTHRLWSVRKGRAVASPVYYDGHLYFVHEQLGIAFCLDAASGDTVYERRLEPTPGEMYASPVIADGKLYYVSRRRGTYVLAATPRFEQLAVNELGDRSLFNGSPAVAGQQLLLRSDRYLYCVESAGSGSRE